jgi:ankyrin repeat protein
MKLFKRENQEEKLFEAVISGLPKKAIRCLKQGAEINAKNEQGNTPVHVAVASRQKEIVGLLAERGTDVNAANPRGDTPLHLAAEADDRDIAELLIAKGADVNARNRQGRTPLHVAAMKHHTSMVESLAAHGADASVKDRSGETALQLARHKLESWDRLTANGAQGYKDTAVLDAAGEGYVTISRILRKHGGGK